MTNLSKNPNLHGQKTFDICQRKFDRVKGALMATFRGIFWCTARLFLDLLFGNSEIMGGGDKHNFAPAPQIFSPALVPSKFICRT